MMNKFLATSLLLVTISLQAKDFEALKQEYTESYAKLITSYFYAEQQPKKTQAQTTKKSTQQPQQPPRWADICTKSRNAVVQFFTFCNNFDFIKLATA